MLLLIFHILIFALNCCDGYELRQVQAFFRHGQRIPTSILTFPTEPSGLAKNLPFEPGEMTNEGMKQEYELGNKFREIYGKFTGITYHPLEIRVNAGADNRTLVSAQLSMASFLPPTSGHIWNKNLLWNPIPIFANEIIDDVSFGVFDHCPALKNEINCSIAYSNLNHFYDSQIKRLENQTGLPIPDLYIFQKVLDTLVSRTFLNDMLPLPLWAQTDNYMTEIIRLQFGVHSQFIDLFLDSIGGWHFDQIYSRIDEIVNNRTKQKIIFYAGHDTNLLTLGRFFGISVIDSIMPDYASFLAFELYEHSGEYYIELRYLPNIDNSTVTLEFSRCPHPCKLADFKQLGQSRRTTSMQWMSLCLGQPDGNTCNFYGTIAGTLIIVLILLLALTLSLLCSFCHLKRRYEALDDMQRKPLLGTRN